MKRSQGRAQGGIERRKTSSGYLGTEILVGASPGAQQVGGAVATIFAVVALDLSQLGGDYREFVCEAMMMGSEGASHGDREGGLTNFWPAAIRRTCSTRMGWSTS